MPTLPYHNRDFNLPLYIPPSLLFFFHPLPYYIHTHLPCVCGKKKRSHVTVISSAAPNLIAPDSKRKKKGKEQPDFFVLFLKRILLLCFLFFGCCWNITWKRYIRVDKHTSVTTAEALKWFRLTDTHTEQRRPLPACHWLLQLIRAIKVALFYFFKYILKTLIVSRLIDFWRTKNNSQWPIMPPGVCSIIWRVWAAIIIIISHRLVIC